ncbi:MAG: AAA family ATPase, partial [Deltaproteobacteria bacterium]|nr:AAA family ATPase [Deltaproteobacteria bacterium]
AAANLAERLIHRLERDGTRAAFEEDLKALERRLGERRELVRAWTDGFVRVSGLPVDSAVTEEAAGILLTERRLDRHATASPNAVEVSGLLGQHRRIVERKMSVRLDELEERLAEFVRTTVPGFRELRKARHELLERERSRLRLEELKPRVLSSFVRNRLIDEVYLPLIGTNLAKQLGAAGEAKRTDLMGLLLLISPPGYGKTTLMEYVASRLGLVFVKVNGPSLGEAVRSFDPEEAPNATARQEVDKINLAFEMGNNVMLYLDDIQHTSAELLQKFISLCDAQRRVEGVWKGRTRTYDLRGKKFCVVMAGNPYTESGARFQIPDMLANRADTYNLGDILEGKDDVFALSYVENAVTSNPVLAPLATRDMADLYKLVRIAKGEEVPTTDLSFGYSAAEIGEIVAVLQRLFKVQSVLLRVNMEYIASASQDDRFRAEPAFKLQGSYRNMNKLAEKIVAAMNDEEIERLIDDHYGQESQTLTTGAEHNLLKLKELRGRLTDGDKARWAEIKKAFAKAKARGGDEADPATRVTGELSSLGEHLEGIRDAVSQAVWHQIEGTKKKKPARSDLFLAPVLQSIPPLLEKIDATLERLAPPMSPPTAPPPGREGGGEGGPRGDEPG